MHREIAIRLTRQTDERVLRGFTLLIQRDRRRKADFLVYLNEVDRRKLYAKQGYSSLFRFLTEKFHLSESSALKRIQVARLVQKFPFLKRDLSDGLFSLTALSRVAPFLTGANCSRILKKCEHKSVRAVEAVLVEEFPKADVEESLKKKISPLGQDRFHVQFMADDEFAKDLEKARAFLSHQYPQGKMADIMKLALRQLVEGLEKKKFRREANKGTPGRHIPREIPNERLRHIPRGIQREVLEMNEARCQFKKLDGTLCGETHFLEIDHVQPFALGGKHQRENLRLLCWTHNQLRAESQFGKRWAKTPRAGAAPPV